MAANQLLSGRAAIRKVPSTWRAMRYEHVPAVNVRYWITIALASIFGCNLGDFISFPFHWNHWIGLVPLAAAFAAIVFKERRSAEATATWYWTAVVILRAAATNLADLATHTFQWSYPIVILGLAIVQVLVVIPVLPRLVQTGIDRTGRPAANGWYWMSLLTAGTLGTAVGDYAAEQLHLGTGGGTLLLGSLFALILAAGRRSQWTTKLAYWTAIVAVRAAGTTAGDWLAFRDDPGLKNGLDLGLHISTVLTCAFFVAVVVWRKRAAAPEGQALACGHPLVRSKPRSWLKGKFVLWSLMALAGISVLFSTEIPILRDQSGPDHLFHLTLIRDRYLFIPHALGGVLATFAGPIQFSNRLRRKRLQLHRFLGRVYAYSVFTAAILAVVIDWHRPLFVGSTVQATAWFFCTLFAVLTARNRHIVQHRQWMIRSYAMTFTFVAVRFLNFWPGYANMPDATFNIVDILVTFLSVTIPTIAFNWSEIIVKRT